MKFPMKSLRLLIAMLISLCVCHGTAQIYRVDTFHGDSLTLNELTVIDGKEAVGVPLFKIANGDTVSVTRAVENFTGYAVTEIDGKEYAVSTAQLCFIDKEGVEDPFDTLQVRWRTPEGRYFSTLTPYIHIVCLVAGALILGLLALRVRWLRFFAVLLLPLLIAAACYIEVNAWLALHSDMFWWCDQHRFGFWGSVLRVIPFSLVIVGQFASYPIYKMLLINKDNPKTAMTSILPMGLSFLVAIPVIFIVLLVCALFHMAKPTQAIVGTVLLAVIVGVGSLTSITFNIRALGVIRGLWFSLFGAVYIIGAMIAATGFVIALWNILLQVLITVVPWAFIVLMLTHASAPVTASHELSYEEQKAMDEARWKKADEEYTRRWRYMLFQNGKRDRY